MNRRTIQAGILSTITAAVVHADIGITFESREDSADIEVPAERVKTFADGVRWVERDGRLTLQSTASASWDTTISNESLRRHDQRMAWLRANLQAKTQMAHFLEGATLENRARINEEWRDGHEDLKGQFDSSRVGEDRSEQASQSFLRGIVLENIVQDEETGQVTVTVMSSPRSREARQVWGEGVIEVQDLTVGRDQVLAEIIAGVVPPAGGQILINPSSGERMWIAYGSHFANSQQRERGLTAPARTIADLRARSTLVAMLRGENIAARDLVDQRYVEILEGTNDFLAGGQTGEVQRLAEQTANQYQETIISGTLPPGTESMHLTGDHGIWHHTVLTYQPSQVDHPSSGDQNLTIPIPSHEDAGRPSDPSAAVRILRAVGEGETRRAAIHDALLEAVSMINGALVHGHSIVAQQYQNAVRNFDEQLETRQSSDGLTSETIEATSRGLVQRYDLLAEQRNEQGIYRVEIKAWVPIFDPDTPRPGELPTVTVLPLQQSSTAELKPQEASTITSGITQVLLDSGIFTVLDDRYLLTLDDHRRTMLDRISRGDAAISEIIKFGHALTADYVVVGSIDRLNYDKDRVWVPVRKAYETRESLEIKVDLRLINISTGTIEWMDTFEREWTAMDLVRRPFESRRLSPSQFACRSALVGLVTSLSDYLSTRVEP